MAANGRVECQCRLPWAISRDNDCGDGSCENMAVLTTGTDATLWGARDISLERNTGRGSRGRPCHSTPSLTTYYGLSLAVIPYGFTLRILFYCCH